MDSFVPDRQIKKKVIDRMRRCGVCHHEFVPDDIKVVSRKPAMWTMVVECDECHARSFVAAMLHDSDPSEAREALRDLSEGPGSGFEDAGISEESSISKAPPVVTDDVLDMHEFLRGFDGDFQKLFRSA
ncbi:MAG TPA: hypothetical protein VGR16_11250 [Thermomicrobiales bacterium]|nr:hypothetical protein [Thermomicrobiales bacterium]